MVCMLLKTGTLSAADCDRCITGISSRLYVKICNNSVRRICVVTAACDNSFVSVQIGVVLASAVSDYSVAFVNMVSDASKAIFYSTLCMNPVLLKHKCAIVAETVTGYIM